MEKTEKMTAEILISVIIVTRNRIEQVQKAIESIKQSNFSQKQIEIIVADNNDDSQTKNKLLNRWPDITIIGGCGNRGVTKPRNEAAKMCHGKYLYFMDDDAWVDENVFDAALKGIQNIPNVFAVRSHIRFIKSDGYMGSTPMEKILPSYSLCLTLFESCFMVEKEKFINVGGFNENLFFGGEGEDLSLRAFYYGYFSVYALESITYHPSNSTKAFNAENLVNAISARSIIARSLWPMKYGILCILKAAFYSSIEDGIRHKDCNLCWMIATRTIKNAFKNVTRCPKISTSRFKQFRKIRNQRLAIALNCIDYSQIIFENS